MNAPLLSPAARVGIIGGGASGLAAAHALRELGCRRVTLFEREPRAGGKCCTLVHDGRTYELGAALVTPAYRHVRSLMREVGVRATAQTEGLLAATRDGATRRLPAALRPGCWPRIAMGGARFALALARQPDLFRPGFSGLSDDLALPFDEWCRARRCEAVEAAVEPWVTGFGYGFLRDLPAAYVLKYATLFGVPLFEILEDGYGGLFDKVAASLEPVEVRTSARVTAVERRADGVTVHTADGPTEFDALVVACPPDDALAFLDATPAEVDLFERVRWQAYFVLGASVQGALPRARYTFLHDNLAPSAVGLPMFAYRRWPGVDAVFFYGFVREAEWERAARREVAACVERLGGRLREVIVARRWRYFPHVQPDDFAAGYYRRLEALQGCNRTLYCGELLAFGAVETVVAYARALVRRHFAPPTPQD
jgi:phytoene dehydrogenase-like protein